MSGEKRKARDAKSATSEPAAKKPKVELKDSEEKKKHKDLGDCPNCKFHLTQSEEDGKIEAKEKYPRVRYLRLTEYNDWEGETWSFYESYTIQDEKDEAKWDDLLYRLKQILKSNGSWSSGYDITEDSAKGAVDNACGTGYMDSDNWGGELDQDELRVFLDCKKCSVTAGQNEDCDGWYKGQYQLYCSCEPEAPGPSEAVPVPEGEDDAVCLLIADCSDCKGDRRCQICKGSCCEACWEAHAKSNGVYIEAWETI